MTDAVEKLTGIMRDCGKSRQVKGGLGHLDYEEHLNAAQAILDEIRKDPLAYIPVKELEWGWNARYKAWGSNQINLGLIYWVQQKENGTFTVAAKRGGSTVMHEMGHPTLEAAQAEAQEHFNNQVKGMLDV